MNLSAFNSGIGSLTKNQITHEKTGVGASDNIFLVSEAVQIEAIYGYVDSVVDSTVFTDVKLELDDAGIQVDLVTEVAGAGVAAGALFLKTDVYTQPFTLLSGASVGATEGGEVVFFPNIILQKVGVATYIRLNYEGNGVTEVTITWHVRYHKLTDGAAITAV